MHAMVADRRRSDALRHYEALAVSLHRELKIAPDAATSALRDELRKIPADSAERRTIYVSAPPERPAESAEPTKPLVPGRKQVTTALWDLTGPRSLVR